MRSLLLLSPGCDAGRALRCGADAVILDLAAERDGDRAAARRWAAGVLSDLRPGRDRPRPIVACGALASTFEADAAAVLPEAPDAVMVRGLVGAHDIEHVAAKLAVAEAEAGRPHGATRILALAADTPRGVLALATLPQAGRRLLALGWDGAALAATLPGVGPDAEPIRVARTLLLIAAAAVNVPALDFEPRHGDDHQLQRACERAGAQGFSGLATRDPAGVAILNAAFAARP